MTSGQLIRRARLEAGLTQAELGRRIERTAQQVARWEADGYEPGLSTLRHVLRACGFDLAMELVPYEPRPELDEELRLNLSLTPQERLQRLYGAPHGPGG